MRIAILAATALLALPQLAHAQAKVTMGLSHQLPPAHHIAKVVEAFANEGPTLRRFQPRARGRATRIRKRTSHITIVVSDTEEEED